MASKTAAEEDLTAGLNRFTPGSIIHRTLVASTASLAICGTYLYRLTSMVKSAQLLNCLAIHARFASLRNLPAALCGTDARCGLWLPLRGRNLDASSTVFCLAYSGDLNSSPAHLPSPQSGSGG